MDVTDAYLAGIFDGEGWITLVRKPRKSGMSATLIVGARMVQKPAIELLHSRFGGSLSLRPSTNPAHNATWQWRACAGTGADALKAMLPWLLIKREAALLGIELVDVNARAAVRAGRAIPPDVDEARRAILAQFDALPKRGTSGGNTT